MDGKRTLEAKLTPWSDGARHGQLYLATRRGAISEWKVPVINLDITPLRHYSKSIGAQSTSEFPLSRGLDVKP